MFTPLYPLPPYLQGIQSQVEYNSLVDERAMSLLKKDRRRKRPCALGATRKLYRDKINDAFVNNGIFDPFTGDTLRWDLVKKRDPSHDIAHHDFMKESRLLPTVDHKDPYSDVLEFEICSMVINDCKSDQTPEEFIKMCRTISEFRMKEPSTVNRKPSTPKFYFLPAFLIGICTEEDYRKWLIKRAQQLLNRDLAQGRPCALHSCRSEYKKHIHTAVIATGLFDPYTGERMKYELIGTWDTSKDQPYDYNKQFYLLPTVDHVNPWADVLELEICSRRINMCKSGLTPDEFVEVCGRVVENCPHP